MGCVVARRKGDRSLGVDHHPRGAVVDEAVCAHKGDAGEAGVGVACAAAVGRECDGIALVGLEIVEVDDALPARRVELIDAGQADHAPEQIVRRGPVGESAAVGLRIVAVDRLPGDPDRQRVARVGANQRGLLGSVAVLGHMRRVATIPWVQIVEGHPVECQAGDALIRSGVTVRAAGANIVAAAQPLLAGVVGGADHAIIAGGRVERMHATGFGGADVIGADIAIIAARVDRLARGASAVSAAIVVGARLAVIAGGGIVDVGALAGIDGADIVGAEVPVVTVEIFGAAGRRDFAARERLQHQCAGVLATVARRAIDVEGQHHRSVRAGVDAREPRDVPVGVVCGQPGPGRV